jgi:hypothetical protein
MLTLTEHEVSSWGQLRESITPDDIISLICDMT